MTEYLPRPARLLLAEAYLFAILVRVGMACISMRRVLGVLASLRHLPGRPGGVGSCEAAADIASGAVGHPTCLYRSLTTFAMLSRRRLAPRLHLGAMPAPDFGAHAWVTAPGTRTDEDAASCIPLWSFPTSR